MTHRKSEKNGIQERLKREKEIENEIEDIEGKLHHFPDPQPLIISANQAKSRIDSFIYQNGGNELKLSQQRLSELKSLKTDHENKELKAGEIKAEYDQMMTRLNELKTELENFQYHCSEQEVLNYQGELKKAKQEVTDLRTKISELSTTTDRAETLIKEIAVLKQKREDLLADTALGNANKDSLPEIDKQIEEKNKMLADHNASKAQEEEVIRGLNRKLRQAEMSLNKIEAEGPYIICHYLIARSETVGKDYIRKAETTITRYGELIALNRLIEIHAPESFKKRLLGKFRQEMMIPLFDLEAFGDLIKENADFLFKSINIDVPSVVDAERQRILALGIDLE